MFTLYIFYMLQAHFIVCGGNVFVSVEVFILQSASANLYMYIYYQEGNIFPILIILCVEHDINKAGPFVKVGCFMTFILYYTVLKRNDWLFFFLCTNLPVLVHMNNYIL